jgi:hypothetical protein
VDHVDFVPLTAAGQRRTLTGFLYSAVFANFFLRLPLLAALSFDSKLATFFQSG